MIGPNAASASLAHADDRRINARDDEYLARFGGADLIDAMGAALAAFPHCDHDEMTERGFTALVRLVTS